MGKFWDRLFPRAPVTVPAVVVQPRAVGFMGTNWEKPALDRQQIVSAVFQRTINDFKPRAIAGVAMDGDVSTAMDAVLDSSSLKTAWNFNYNNISDSQALWYSAQSFVGYQFCAILVQHWLIDKACTMPARDATRNGYDITVNDGVKLPPGTLDYMRELDRKFGMKRESREFVRNCRVFGIRIALFEVDGIDYEAPFNPDGVKAGSYKGISQPDPYWITPELDFDAATNPASRHFYEPTYWRINGKRYHRTHLIVIKTCDVPDVLKPTYFYGGVPLPQRIYERVYAAERTANEAPQMAMTKRSTVIHADLEAAAGNQKAFEDKLALWAYYRDNYGIKAVGLDEKIEQFDTTLNDFDELIMTQYQLVAAIAETPATKLLGTVPKGFNSTGDYERDSYHEFLESINEHDVLPLLERHHLLCVRSYVMPKFSIAQPFRTTVVFNELDSETAMEKATRTKMEADRDKVWADSGALDGIDIRNRLIEDPDSGYNGIEEAIPAGPRPMTVVSPGAEKTAPNVPPGTTPPAPASPVQAAPPLPGR